MKRTAAIIVIVAAALFLAWTVVNVSVVDALVKERPALAARVAPGDPRARLGQAMVQFRTKGVPGAPKAAAMSKPALNEAPLAEEPFLLNGVAALLKEDEAGAQRLLAEARRRNPRSRAARLFLLAGYLRANQIPQATGEITILMRLLPQARQVLVPELAKYAQNPRTSSALQQSIRSDPVLQGALLEHLANKGADTDLILRMASGIRPGAPGAADWQGALIKRLVEDGQAERAYDIWKRFTGVQAGSREAGIYDGGFRRLPGAPPFNWTFSTGKEGVAEPDQGGLQVDYYGRDNGEMASQLLMLPPGRYRMSFRAEGSATGEGSRLVWQITCQRGGTGLLAIPLTGIDYSPRPVAGLFQVPANCPAQWLRLQGISTEFSKAQNVKISDLRIAKVNA